MKALPKRFYGDPAECVDELRRLEELAKRAAERTLILKRLRIRGLVKQAMERVKR